MSFSSFVVIPILAVFIWSPAAQGQETAWDIVRPFTEIPDGFVSGDEELRSPLLFADGRRVSTPEEWEDRRAEILAQWQGLMGAWPPLIKDQSLEVLSTEMMEGYRRERVRFRWTPGEKTEGWLLVPDGAESAPAVVTVYYEPDTSVGLGKADRDFALQLVRKGFVCLSIGTTEATEAKTYALYHPDIDHATVQPLSMLAYAAANAWHALAKQPEVDARRIGITGHSFGGKWSMFASCLFDKFACAAWSDAGIVFQDDRPSINYWEPWYLGWHPRPWRKRGLVTAENPAHGLYPMLREEGRDLHELHALMAPRPFLVSGGSEDPPERWRALHHSLEVNRLLGHGDRVAMTNRPDHAPNEESNRVLVAFFEHWLIDRAQEWESE